MSTEIYDQRKQVETKKLSKGLSYTPGLFE